MSWKKAEIYRGFIISLEEVRPGAWGLSVVEVPSGEGAGPARTPGRGRVPGEHASKASALEAARAHVDRIQKNRRNKASQSTG